ncbi:type II secretion system protein [bacterium]|nr:type II secretion system protein [bacterium]
MSGGGGFLANLLDKKKTAFTLAETLISLAIIGIIAAMTLPSLMQNLGERSNSERAANTVQKIAQSMDLMRVDGELLTTYQTTDQFVDELAKHLKIVTRCDKNHLTNCWPVEKVLTGSGDEVNVADIKTGEQLGLNTKTDNVGLVLATGVPIILNYNPDAGIVSDTDTTTQNKIKLPAGWGRYKEYVWGNNTMGSVAFVMDVNGPRGPNKGIETIENKLIYHDIRSFGGASLQGDKCDGCLTSTAYGKYKLLNDGAVWTSSIDCSDNANKDYCDEQTGASKWAAANKACQDLGLSLPWKTGEDEALPAGNFVKFNKENPDLLPSDGCVWTAYKKDDGSHLSFPLNYKNKLMKLMSSMGSQSARGQNDECYALCVEK